MKTWQAALAHMGLGALQVGTGLQFFTGNTPQEAAANVGIGLGIQTGLAFLQAFVAKRNSNTDPNGKNLVQYIPGKYATTEVKKEDAVVER